MARPSQKATDRNLAEQVVWKFQQAAHNREPRQKAWDIARKRYDPSYVDKTKVKRAPYTKQGYVYRTVNNQLSGLLEASEANGTYVVAHATTPEFGSVGGVVTQAVDRQFRWGGSSVARGNIDRLERIAGNGLLHGTGIIYCDWMDHPDDWGVRFTCISPWDFFPDWRGENWYIIRRWINVSDLADMARSLSAPIERVLGVDEEGEKIIERTSRDGGRAERVFKRVLKDLKDGLRSSAPENVYGPEFTHGYAKTQSDVPLDLHRVNDDLSGGMDGPSPDPFVSRIEILQYVETHPDGIVSLVVPGFGNGTEHLVLRKERNPYPVCQIAVFSPSPVGNEFWGYGISEIVGSRAEVMDYLERSQIRVVDKSANAPLLHRRNLRLRRDFLASPSGKAVEVDDIATAMGYLSPGLDPGFYAFAHQFSKQQADEATGSSPEQRGQSGSAGSATEAAIAEAGGNTNNRLIFRRWRRFIEQVGSICLEMLKVHITEEKAIPMLGRDADTLLRLKPEFLRGTFEVRFGGSLIGSNNQQDIANRNAIAQAYGSTGVLDMNAMARDALTKIGIVNPDDFLLQDAGRPKVSATHENQAWLEFGQEPIVHAQDNDIEHFVKHRKVFLQLAQENPADPRLPIMEAHLGDHMAAAQVKAQQQMVAQAQPGAQPQAQQAGGAGQPQVLNARTANIQQMRQQPNIEAAGQAPGGVVPNRPVGGIAFGGPQQ